jgi:4-amino-4-deoxy-L-arabinose transferase-like glycosyltransferase
LRRFRWLTVGWIVVFWRLGYQSLLDPDEAHYAELTREMMQAGNWLVPLLDGKPFIDKPVLFHWLQGASVFLLGQSEFAARLPSALAALALIGVTRWVGAVLFGAAVGEWGALMFATIPATFALASIAMFDMVFGLFLFGGIGCLAVAAKQNDARSEWSGYGLLALAVMTKGPVALLLVALFLGAAWLASSETRTMVRTLHWKSGLLAVAVAASPWFVWMAWQFGPEFVTSYVLAGNLWYFTQPILFSGRAVSHTFYARAFAGAFFPWSAIAVGHGIDMLRGRRAGLRLTAEETLLWTWVFVVIGFFSLARFKLDHYIFPAAPACCLLAAHAWRSAAADENGRFRMTRFSVLAIAAILIIGGSFGLTYLPDLALELPRTALALPLTLLVGGIVLMTQAARRHWRVPANAAVLVVMLVVTYGIVVAVGFPVLERARPTAMIATRLARVTPAAAPVGIYRLERWRASLRYYLNRPIQRLETTDDLIAFVSRREPAYVVMLRRDYDEFRKAGVPIRVLMQHRAVVGTTGRGLRKQRWGYLVVATNRPRARPQPASGDDPAEPAEFPNPPGRD